MARMPGAYRQGPPGATGGHDSVSCLAVHTRRTYGVIVSRYDVRPWPYPLNTFSC